MLKKLCSEIFSSGVSMYGIYIGSPDMDMAAVKWDPSLLDRDTREHLFNSYMFLFTAITGVNCTCDALSLSTPSGAIYSEYPGMCFYNVADALAFFTQPVDAFCTNLPTD